MNRVELIKKTLLQLLELQQTEGYQEVANYILLKEQEPYLLFEVDREIDDLLSDIDIKKYALTTINNIDFINPNELENGKKLHKDLLTIITNFLTTDYVLIVYTENKSRYINNQNCELFDLVFKKTFVNKKTGKIKTRVFDSCQQTISIGDTKHEVNNHLNVGIDLVYKDNLTYNGHSLNGENVLFYGHNIEENRFLIELFKIHRPAKLLNIVPLSGTKTFFEDVD